MNKVLPIIVVITLLNNSCAFRSKRSSTQGEALPQTASAEALSNLDHLLASQGDTLMISTQELTSYEKVLEAFHNAGEYDYLHESANIEDAFFAPEPDIKESELMRNVKLRYNYVSVMNRVLHAYEWFNRVSADIGDEEERPRTHKDTLAWVKASQPGLTDSFISRVVPDQAAQKAAKRLVSAYRQFDGNDGEDSEFYKAFRNLNEVYEEIPAIVSDEAIDAFEEKFWDWYDKEKVVPGISRIIRMHMKDYDGEKLSDEKIASLRLAVKREKDIDRRTVLALEYVKFDRLEGSIILGDIIDSGIYTKYLLEAWIAWRANTQMGYSPSSFSVIPNKYYDRLRVKCLNTMLRHCQEGDDTRTRIMMENLIDCEIIHRMGSIAGNSSFTTCMNLSYDEFIHPSLLADNQNSK